MQQGMLETNLANVMIAELAGPATRPVSTDSDDRFPLIEILAEAAFSSPDDLDSSYLVTTRKLPPRGVFVDADDTLPHALYSSPYERVDVGVELAPARRPRKRAATITRTALAQHRAAPPAPETDAAVTTKLPRFSSPYEKIEIERPSAINLVASGSFEAAWFVPPEEALPSEIEESPVRTWIAIVAASLLAASAVTLAAVL